MHFDDHVDTILREEDSVHVQFSSQVEQIPAPPEVEPSAPSSLESNLLAEEDVPPAAAAQ